MGKRLEWSKEHRPQLARLGLVAVPAAVGGWWVWPEESTLPGTSVPSALFDDVFILGSTRVILLLGLAYVTLSIMARAWQGSWLKSVGATAAEPVAESAEELREQAVRDRRNLRQAQRTIVDLTKRLEGREGTRANMKDSQGSQETDQ